MAPRRTYQLSLHDSQKTTEEVLAFFGVSADEANRWHEKGWLSFDSSKEWLTSPERDELIFVRNLAQFGLSDALVERFLGYLEGPAQYDPMQHAFSFTFGWVSVPPDWNDGAVSQVVDAYFEKWIEERVEDGDTVTLMRAEKRIKEAIGRAFRTECDRATETTSEE